MTKQLEHFWESFSNKDFQQAQQQFDSLDDTNKQELLAQLYQKTAHQQTPLLVSVLKRELRDEQSFDDFYQAWFPGEEMTNKIEHHGQTYQQHFPLPVRVLNAVNLNDPKDILSIGLTWVNSEEQEQGLWEHIDKAKAGDDENNETRHEKIDDVAEGELLGLFRVATDDNLGSPF